MDGAYHQDHRDHQEHRDYREHRDPAGRVVTDHAGPDAGRPDPAAGGDPIPAADEAGPDNKEWEWL